VWAWTTFDLLRVRDEAADSNPGMRGAGLLLHCVAEFVAMSEKAAPVDQTARPAPGGEMEAASPEPPNEIGGRDGPEPVRYGDWEKQGRCIDF
jgi:hypothetical protein